MLNYFLALGHTHQTIATCLFGLAVYEEGVKWKLAVDRLAIVIDQASAATCLGLRAFNLALSLD